MRLLNSLEWEPMYERILADFGFSREDDEASVRLLKAVTMGSDLIDPDDLRPSFSRTSTVIGGSASLEEDISVMKPEGVVLCSGSAVGRCVEAGIQPDMVVTDLDGDIGPQLEASSGGAVTFIHAHGDNMELIRQYAGRFEGPVVLTTQSRPENTVSDFGGFTDGDRAVCIAEEMGSRRVVLLGFDFLNPGPKTGSDPGMKRRKLVWAERIIGSLDLEIVRPTRRSSVEFYRPGFIRAGHRTSGIT